MLDKGNNMSIGGLKNIPKTLPRKYNPLIESINKSKVTEYDYSSKKIDSFILKLTNESIYNNINERCLEFGHMLNAV